MLLVRIVKSGEGNPNHASDGKFTTGGGGGGGGGGGEGSGGQSEGSSKGDKATKEAKVAELRASAEREEGFADKADEIYNKVDGLKHEKGLKKVQSTFKAFKNSKATSGDIASAIDAHVDSAKSHFLSLANEWKESAGFDDGDWVGVQKKFGEHLSELKSHVMDAADHADKLSIDAWDKANPEPEQDDHSAVRDSDVEEHDSRHERRVELWEKRRERAKDRHEAAVNDLEYAIDEYETAFEEAVSTHVEVMQDHLDNYASASREEASRLNDQADELESDDDDGDGDGDKKAAKNSLSTQEKRAKSIRAKKPNSSKRSEGKRDKSFAKN